MLISFTFENWRSFRDEASFSMVATSEKRHRDRLAHIPSYDRGRKRFELLPLAAMYGGNASGKSNFAKALDFVRRMVVTGVGVDARIGVQPFRLRDKAAEKPSRFSLVFLVKGKLYSYDFSLTTQRVESETLSLLTKTGTAKQLYSRSYIDGERVFEFEARLDEDEAYLKSQGDAVPDNQLFLTHVHTLRKKVEILEEVWQWFGVELAVVFPSSEYSKTSFLLHDDNPMLAAMNKVFPCLDTGISRIAGKHVPIERHEYAAILRIKLGEFAGDTAELSIAGWGRVFCERVNGAWFFVKLVAFHKDQDGNEVEFDFSQESDGSQRLYDLFPAFLLNNEAVPRIVIIDEIDRSLHPLMTRQLLDIYLSSRTPESRSQLILTTHDAMLLDQDLLRRDEIWVAERDDTGASKIYSFSEFKDVRADKDIRKSYLQGRLGGVPRLRISGVFCSPEREPEHE